MPSSDPIQRFQDILDNITRIEQYTTDMNSIAFAEDHKTYDAVERCLARISEAATKLGAVAESLCPGIPWPDIRGLGNFLRHEYDRVDRDRIWFVVVDNMPPLQAGVHAALRICLKVRASSREADRVASYGRNRSEAARTHHKELPGEMVLAFDIPATVGAGLALEARVRSVALSAIAARLLEDAVGTSTRPAHPLGQFTIGLSCSASSPIRSPRLRAKPFPHHDLSASRLAVSDLWSGLLRLAFGLISSFG